MPSALYFLCFALLLPCEMLIWGRALDQSLEHTYLAQSVSLNILMEIPGGVLLLLMGIILCCILKATWSLNRNSHEEDGLLYGSIISLTGLLFLYFKLPCSFAFLIPLMCLGCCAAWYSSSVYPLRKSFLLPGNTARKATFAEYARAFHLLLGIQCGGCIIFQSGYSFCFSYPETTVFVLLPFLGLIQYSPGKLRGYVNACFGAMILCAGVYGIAGYFLYDLMQSDLGIYFTVLFVVLECILILRQWCGQVRNLSILLLIPATGLASLFMPQICSSLLIPLSAFILYLLVDNTERIRHYIFSFAHKRNHHASRQNCGKLCKALAWSAGVILSSYLLGEAYFREVLICTGVLLAGALLHIRFLSDRHEEHLILRNFPYITEIIFLCIALLILSDSRAEFMGFLCAFACGLSLAQSLRHTGEFLGWISSDRGILSRICLAAGWTILTFLMLLLFFRQLPACFYLGIFLILLGVLLVLESACHKEKTERRLTAGWVLVVLGQFISVTSPEIMLPVPEFYAAAFYPGLYALLAAFCIFYFQKIRKNKKDTLP